MNRLPGTALGSATDRVDVRGGVVGGAQCHDLAVAVVEQLHCLRAVDQVMGDLVQRNDSTLLDRHTRRLGQLSHPLIEDLERHRSPYGSELTTVNFIVTIARMSLMAMQSSLAVSLKAWDARRLAR